MIGERIGAYVIVEQIGAGGMGTVWLAEHAMIGRRAAIKMLHANMSSSKEVTTRFFNEARAAAAIQDGGIVQVFDFGQHTDGRAYIVMELLEGEPLDRRLTRLGRLNVSDALRIMRQVASSLGAAHARGIIHRDLKPDNIFLARDTEVAGGERAKILDFGIAKMASAAGMTDTAVVMGTPSFMSPEQCRGAGKVDQRSDVYSLGCVLFTLLTGRTPFVAEGPGDLIAMHLREVPPVPSTLAPAIPPIVDSLVLRCMEKDPSRRYESGKEVAEAIGAIPSFPRVTAQGEAQTPTDPPSPALGGGTTLTSYSQLASQRSVSSPPTSRRDRLALLAVTGVCAAGIAAFLLLRGDGSENAAALAAPQGNAATLDDLSVDPAPAPARPAAADLARVPVAVPAPPAPPPLEAPQAEAPQVAPSEPAPEPTPEPVAVDSAPTAEESKSRSSSKRSSKRTAKQERSEAGDQALAAVQPEALAPPTPAPPTPAIAAAPPPEPSSEGDRAVEDAARLEDCKVQTAKLKAFIQNSYRMKASGVMQEAARLKFSCLDPSQRRLLATAAIRAACALEDEASTLRYYEIGGSASLRSLCPKFLESKDRDLDDGSPYQ